MLKKFITTTLDRLLDRKIRLYDMFVMDKQGNIFIFRPKEKRRIELNGNLDKISTENIYEEGGKKIFDLAQKEAALKGCGVRWIYEMKEKDWLWAVQLCCRRNL